MGQLILGLIMGVILMLVLYLLFPLITGGKVTDAELEAWIEWRTEWKCRQAVEEKMREMGAVEMPMMGEDKRRGQGKWPP
ncbi:MAG: hypothetical protein M0P14_07230 [Alkaliphilus sp.]|nr:hypothetical protein [Alkaliphilus sp.]